jgi:hypothetical protein
MNHTAISAPSRAAVVLPSPSGFSPSYGELGTGMLAQRHCRLSPQEIKYRLCRWWPLSATAVNLPDTWPQDRKGNRAYSFAVDASA